MLLEATKRTRVSHEATRPTTYNEEINCFRFVVVDFVASCKALVLFVLFLSLFGCSGERTGPPANALPTRPAPLRFAVEGRSNASASVAAFGKRVAVVWTASSESASDVYMSVSADSGATFGAPVRVNDVEGDARTSGEQPARVVMDKTIHVVWPARENGRTVIRYARSTDDGRTFSRTVTAAGGGLPGARGWHGAGLGYDGGVHLVWLDGRNATPHQHQQPHQHGKPATKSAAPRQAPRQDLFHASWKGDGAPVERPVASNVCFCCKTAVASSGEKVYVAWRHIFPGSIRDIAIARSDDNGKTFGEPTRLSDDGWKIDACPDDGPAMAFDSHGGIHVAWPTLVVGHRPRKGIFYASLGAHESAFTSRLRLDSGDSDPSHPQIASDEHGNTAVVWDEHAGGKRRIAMRRVSSGTAQPAQVFDGDGMSYPAAAAAEGHWIVLWSAQSADGKSTIEGRRIPF
jgi:hypothetical protein